MSKFSQIVLITLAAWLISTVTYGYYWVASILEQPDLAVYERGPLLPTMGFLIYRFPYLLLVLFVVTALELIFIPAPWRKPSGMVYGNNGKQR